MKKNARQIAIVLLLFFVVGMVTAFALTDAEYNSLFKQGYQDGYTGGGNRVTMRQFGGRSSEEKAAYNAGYRQGEMDRKAGKDNAYMPR